RPRRLRPSETQLPGRRHSPRPHPRSPESRPGKPRHHPLGTRVGHPHQTRPRHPRSPRRQQQTSRLPICPPVLIQGPHFFSCFLSPATVLCIVRAAATLCFFRHTCVGSFSALRIIPTQSSLAACC